MFFRGPTMHEYYRAAEEKVKQEINSRPDEYILVVETEEYAAYLFDKFSLLPVEHDTTREMLVEQTTKWQERRDEFDEMMRQEIVLLKVTYPVIQHTKIAQVLEILPTLQRTTTIHTFEYDQRQFALILTTFTGSVENDLESLKRWLEAHNQDIQAFNPALLETIKRLIKARKKVVEQRAHDLAALVQRSSIPLKIKQASQSPAVDLSIRREIKPLLQPPQPKRPEELVLERDKVLPVLEIIDRAGRQFEITPTTFTKMEEESLRDVILSHLNIVFEGAASGETFSKKGKTDIYLVVQKGGILIAECKYWGGATLYAETINQLFGYLTWRHNYGIIITFSRNVSFTNVLNQVEQATRRHPSFRSAFTQITEGHYQSQHSFPDDPQRLVELHHLVYNLYAG